MAPANLIFLSAAKILSHSFSRSVGGNAIVM